MKLIFFVATWSIAWFARVNLILFYEILLNIQLYSSLSLSLSMCVLEK